MKWRRKKEWLSWTQIYEARGILIESKVTCKLMNQEAENSSLILLMWHHFYTLKTQKFGCLTFALSFTDSQITQMLTHYKHNLFSWQFWGLVVQFFSDNLSEFCWALSLTSMQVVRLSGPGWPEMPLFMCLVFGWMTLLWGISSLCNLIFLNLWG